MRVPMPLLAFVLVLGCRPSSEPGQPETTQPADNPSASEASEPAAAVDARERPPGAIFRDEIDRATRSGSPSYLLAQLGPEPYRPQGRFEGWVITRVWPGDPELCGQGCGLVPGDIILTVNGSKLETPESLSAMLERLGEFESIDITGIHDGEFFERSHPIVD